MKWKVLATLAVALAMTSAARAEILSLIPGPASGSVTDDSSGGTAVYSTNDQRPTGTGYIQPFLRITANSSPAASATEGYNTDYRPVQLDEKQDHQYTHSVLMSDLAAVTISGKSGTFYMFLLDANQTGSQPRLSLEDLRIWRGDAANLTGLDLSDNTFSNGSADLVYRLDTTTDDNRVNIPVQNTNGFDANSGSGSGDLYVFIPTSLFTGTNEYLYLYSKFGKEDVTGNTYDGNKGFVQNDGFEEWAVFTGDTQVAAVPEPSSAALVLVGLTGLGLAGLRRYRRLRMAATV